MVRDQTISDVLREALAEDTAAMALHKVTYALIGGMATSYRDQSRFSCLRGADSSLRSDGAGRLPSHPWRQRGRRGCLSSCLPRAPEKRFILKAASAFGQLALRCGVSYCPGGAVCGA